MRTTHRAPATPDTDADHRRAVEAALADLGRTVGTLRCAGSQRLVRLGVSMTHFHVLTLLRHHDAMPMGRLAEVLGASLSATTGIVDRMAERGLVERERVPGDRRVVVVRATNTGIDLVDEAELLRSEAMASALRRLSVDQLDRLKVSAADLHAAMLAELEAQGLTSPAGTPAT